MKKLRLKNPEASPEVLLGKIEKSFIKNISLEGGGKAVMGAAIRVVTDKQKSDVRNVGRAAKGGASQVADLGVKKIMERYIMASALIYGLNPMNADQAFSQIMGENFENYLSGSKKVDSEDRALFVAVKVLISRSKKIPKNNTDKYLASAAILADATREAYRNISSQKRFAQNFVVLMQENLGTPPDEFPPLLFIDFETEAEKKTAQDENHDSRFNPLVNNARKVTTKVKEVLPSRTSTGEQSRLKETRKIEKSIQKQRKAAEKAQNKADKAQVKADKVRLQAEESILKRKSSNNSTE
ncbi:hypothetical protein ACFR81_03945 [Rothia amarae]